MIQHWHSGQGASDSLSRVAPVSPVFGGGGGSEGSLHSGYFDAIAIPVEQRAPPTRRMAAAGSSGLDLMALLERATEAQSTSPQRSAALLAQFYAAQEGIEDMGCDTGSGKARYDDGGDDVDDNDDGDARKPSSASRSRSRSTTARIRLVSEEEDRSPSPSPSPPSYGRQRRDHGTDNGEASRATANTQQVRA